MGSGALYIYEAEAYGRTQYQRHGQKEGILHGLAGLFDIKRHTLLDIAVDTKRTYKATTVSPPLFQFLAQRPDLGANELFHYLENVLPGRNLWATRRKENEALVCLRVQKSAKSRGMETKCCTEADCEIGAPNVMPVETINKLHLQLETSLLSCAL